MKVLTAERSVALRTLRKDIADDRVPALVANLSSEGLLILARGRVSLPGLR
jgi:hypothetical protein